MMKATSYLLLASSTLFILSCNSAQDKIFNFPDFEIMKGQLGSIKIGMTVPEAEKQFSGLTKKKEDAWLFGFDGGGPAYIYSLNDKIVFSLITSLSDDTVRFIIAVDSNLQTTNDLHPGSTVEELLKQYPDMMIEQNILAGGEFFMDEKNGWDFIFRTDNNNQIGEYPEMEVPSKSKRLDVKADWIVIR